MTSFLLYLIKSSLTLTILYILYWLLLRKGTHFKLNRSILVFTLLISLVLPFISIKIWQILGSSNLPSFSMMLDEIKIGGIGNSIAETSQAVEWPVILLYIYFIGAGLALFRLIYQGIYLYALSHLGKEVYKNDRHTVIAVNADITPFAYFNKIFIPASGIDNLHYIPFLNTKNRIWISTILPILYWYKCLPHYSGLILLPGYSKNH